MAPGRWLGRLGPACAGARVRTVEPWSGVRFGRGEAAAARWFGSRGCVSHGEGREEGRAPGAGARRGRAGQAELAWAHGRPRGMAGACGCAWAEPCGAGKGAGLAGSGRAGARQRREKGRREGEKRKRKKRKGEKEMRKRKKN